MRKANWNFLVTNELITSKRMHKMEKFKGHFVNGSRYLRIVRNNMLLKLLIDIDIVSYF